MTNIKTKPKIKGKASFLLPVFGSLNPDSLFLAITSIQRQEYLKKEVIVVEEHLDEPKFDRLAKSAGVGYIEYSVSNRDRYFSVGRARNAGLVEADGEFLVMHDADIVIQSSGFLDSLIFELISNPTSFLVTTPLHHLQKREIKEWIDDFAISGRFDSYLARCEIHDEHIVSRHSYEDNDFTVVQHPYNELKRHRRYVALRRLYEEYRLDPEKWGGIEPLIFTPCVGKFFIAARTEHVLAVGGYCEKFVNWGCEDGDLKWKLSNFLSCKDLQYDERFSQLHLAHDRPYFNGAVYMENKKISKERQEQGFQSAVAADLLNFDLMLGRK